MRFQKNQEREARQNDEPVWFKERAPEPVPNITPHPLSEDAARPIIHALPASVQIAQNEDPENRNVAGTMIKGATELLGSQDQNHPDQDKP